MDHDGETTTDVSVGVGHSNSVIESDMEVKISNYANIEDSSNETTTVVLKTSLEGQIKTDPVSNTSLCANDTNASRDSVESCESTKLPPSNSVNDTPTIPNGNSTSMAVLASCLTENEQDDDANNNDSENLSKVSNECSIIDNAIENQNIMDKSTTKHSETLSNLNDSTSTSISNEVSKQLPNVEAENNEGTNIQGSKDSNSISDVVLNEEPSLDKVKDTEIVIKEEPSLDKVEDTEIVIKEEPSLDKVKDTEIAISEEPSLDKVEDTEIAINEEPSLDKVEDTEIAIDDSPSSSKKDCDDKIIKGSEILNSEEKSIEQPPANDECIEIVDDGQALEGTKEAFNIESTGTSETTVIQANKEESLCNNAESIEVIDVENNSDETKEIIEIIDVENDNDMRNENNLLQPSPIKKKGRRRSRTTSISMPPPHCSPQLPTTPKIGRGRGGSTFEITDKHLEPFKLGWLREVVERATCSTPKKMWDVYYRSPDGMKKMRSIPDVINYLKLHPEFGLTRENFTFCKDHIYREPFELTRKAKERCQVKSPKTQKQESSKTPKQESNKIPKLEKDKSPKKTQENKPKPTPQPTPTEKQGETEIIICDDGPAMKKLKLSISEENAKDKPVVNVPAAKRGRPSKQSLAVMLKEHSNRKAAASMNKTPNIYEKVYTKLSKPRNDYSRSLRKPDITVVEQYDTAADNEAENEKADDEETSILRSSLNEKIRKLIIKIPTDDTKKVSESSNEEESMVDVNLCSNRCPGSIGEIPSLQCIVCLCLFHPRCMGLNKASTNFICKRCNANRLNRGLSQDEHCKDAEAKTQSSPNNSLEQNDSDSTDDDSTTNVSVLAPEVVIQQDGSDQEEMSVPTTLRYCFPNASTQPSRTIAASDQYQNLVLNNKSNFIRPVPPLTPFPNLIPAPHIQNQLLASKRIIASSTYFPPPVSESPIIRVPSTSYNTYTKVSFTTTNTRPKVSPTNMCSLIGNPPVCSSVRLISPQQLLTAVNPPPLGVPRPALVQGHVNTTPPPLRLVAPTSVSSNVGNCNRIVLPNNSGSCLVLTPQTGVLGPGTTTRLIGPFPSNSIPQIMVVNNKVIYVSPIGNQQLSEQRNQPILTGITPAAQSLGVSSSKDTAPETRPTYIKTLQNNPYLAALLNTKENSTSVKSTNIKPTNMTISNSSGPVSTVTIIDGKISSIAPPKLTAVIPPSFPASKGQSLLHSSNIPTTTAATCPLPTIFVSGGGTLPESPYSNKSYTQEENLAKRIEERYKLCLSVTQTAVLTDGASPGLLNTNINKRMETSTTPAIKSPMTTARLLTGTETSLSFPEAKSKSSSDKCYDSNSEMNTKRIKLEVSPSSSSSSSLNVDNQHISESLEDATMGTERNSLLGEHAYSNVMFDSMCDQAFRTSAFTPSFTTIMNTMTSCYSCLNNIFQFLTTTDLLRAKLVCKCWYKLASQQFLWRKVSLKNLTIVDWRKFAFALEVHGTTYLDLRGHVLFHDTWQNFVSVLSRLDKLRHVECGLIPAFVLYAMASKLVNLKSLTGECAMFSHWTTGRVGPCVINFNLLENFREMEKFQLRCKEGLMATVMGGLWPISHLSKLRHLSLTTLENVDCEQLKFLHKLNNLESLEIGDCTNWTSSIYAYIGKMVNLHTLRLEKGGEVDGLVDALSNLTRLKELHLVIYKIPVSLGTTLQGLTTLRLLSIWPDTATNGPFQNYKALHVVRSLTHLKELRWIILSDNCDIPDKAVAEEGNSWRDKLEEHVECQIDFSHPNSDIPLLPLAEFKKISKSLPLMKNSPRCTSMNGLRESLQEALPSTEIKMFQVPAKQLRKYSAFR